MSDKATLLSELDRCVLEMEDEAVVDVAQQYVDAGFDAYEGITEGLAKGMEKAGQLYEEEDYFVPELLICSDAMYNGLDVLKPHLKKMNPRVSALPSSVLWKATPTILERIWSKSCRKLLVLRCMTWDVTSLSLPLLPRRRNWVKV